MVLRYFRRRQEYSDIFGFFSPRSNFDTIPSENSTLIHLHIFSNPPSTRPLSSAKVNDGLLLARERDASFLAGTPDDPCLSLTINIQPCSWKR